MTPDETFTACRKMLPGLTWRLAQLGNVRALIPGAELALMPNPSGCTAEVRFPGSAWETMESHPDALSAIQDLASSLCSTTEARHAYWREVGEALSKILKAR